MAGRTPLDPLGLRRFELDILLKIQDDMVTWKPPGHWLRSNREAHERSIEFLRGIVAGSPHMDLKENRQCLPRIMVRGTSRRWYEINTRVHYIEDTSRLTVITER